MSEQKLALSRDVSIWEKIAKLRINSLEPLAPKFRNAVLSALSDMREKSIKLGALTVPLDWIVFETLRTEELQQIYYAQGTTKAKTAGKSWHKYGLAVDGVSQRWLWFNTQAAAIVWPKSNVRNAYATQWFLSCGEYFEKYGCKLGARWKNPDLPHVQWGKCADSPILAPLLFLEGGNEKVWRAVNAI